MRLQEILAQPVWKRLVGLQGFAELPAASIETANSFFDFIVQYSLPSPTAGDIHNWLGESTGFDRSLRIDHLQEVFAVCQPSFLSQVREARQLLAPALKSPAKLQPCQRPQI